MTTTDKISNPRNIQIADYDYPLPDDRIALYPAEKRDASKLLVWKNRQIEEHIFHELPEMLPQDTFLFFNDTKVVQARMVLYSESGARIELFCLEPADKNLDIQLAYQAKESCVWKCFVGNNKRWKTGILTLDFEIDGNPKQLQIHREKPDEDAWILRFSWNDTSLSFAEILEHIGKIPLPPYISRQAEEQDKERYQTVFADFKGSVAAPTGGLHFTQDLLQTLQSKNIISERLTLHVGAGTFKPVSADVIGDHSMHFERFVVKKSTIENLCKNLDKNIIPVGTTAMRTIESLYWIGADLVRFPEKETIHVNQWQPYDQPETISAKEALTAILNWMEKCNKHELSGQTCLMIAPGYQFRIAKGLITNFHQPKSTLLLLVSALIGETWREIYKYALQHDFRFLSYGDSCLFLP